MVHSVNDSSDSQHPKSLTVYTLTKVWGYSYKGPAIQYFPGTPVNNHYVDHVQRERIIKHSKAKNSLKEL